MKIRRLLLLVGPLWAVAGAAQIRPMASAVTRLLDPDGGPAIWLGGELRLEQPGFGAHLSGLGAPGWRGGWGGQATAELGFDRPLGGRTRFEVTASGTLDRPIRWSLAGLRFAAE